MPKKSSKTKKTTKNGKKSSSKTKKTSIKKTSSKKATKESSKSNDLTNKELADIKEKIDGLVSITESLKNVFGTMEQTINALEKSVNSIAGKVKDNSDSLAEINTYLKKYIFANVDSNKIDSESKEKSTKNGDNIINNNGKAPNTNEIIGLTNGNGGLEKESKPELEDDDFLPVLKKILLQIRNENPDKKYENIKIIKRIFKHNYNISDEKFEELLIENHLNQNIELIPGTGEFFIKDHFGQVYHNIRL